MEKEVTSLLAGEERKSGERLKLNAAETKNDRVMTAPGLTGQWLRVSLGTWMVEGPREEPCDYPSTNSRAQSGHHGPVETCNHEKKIAEEGAAPCGKYDDVSLLGGQWRAGGSNSPEDLVRGAV
ncbi:hypothetical protein ALC60_03377 [Trachymyrmex zeteki]|uniref:Uncharacterized protein n=1 Tax=Mycetomoellerius zeteki TaxID=64791 RepID=A0A151XAL7_9HYME|nr:hypothetical protein ALC60_03377 [Trachymyrmex zeteki]